MATIFRRFWLSLRPPFPLVDSSTCSKLATRFDSWHAAMLLASRTQNQLKFVRTLINYQRDDEEGARNLKKNPKNLAHLARGVCPAVFALQIENQFDINYGNVQQKFPMTNQLWPRSQTKFLPQKRQIMTAILSIPWHISPQLLPNFPAKLFLGNIPIPSKFVVLFNHLKSNY